MNKYGLLCLLLILHAPLFAASNGLSSAQRLDRLERMVQNQNVSDLLLQVQRLQREVQQLRGELEEQNHGIDALKRRQRELYLDLDGRITASGASTDSPSAPITSIPPAPAPISSVKSGVEPPVRKAINPAKEEAAYQAAFSLLQQGSYPESIGAFRKFLQRYPAGDYADNAQYWLGEASYVTRDFDTSMSEFNKVLSDYPQSSKVRGAMLKIGYIHFEKHNWAQSRKILERLVKEYPRSTEARLAQQRLQRLRQAGH